MTTSTTTRDFLRNFPRMKKVAANGGEILVRDRGGKSFIFRSTDSGVSLAAQLSDLRGAVETGVAKKSLAGFGRGRA